MQQKLISVIGLLTLLILHEFSRTYPYYDFGWLLHIAGGFLLAMALRAFWSVSGIACLFTVFLIGCLWEIFEYFYYCAPMLITDDGWHDISWGVVGAIIFLIFSWLIDFLRNHIFVNF